MGRWLCLLGVLVLVWLGGCSAQGGLRVYSDPRGEFRFAYPNGMTPTATGSLKERVVLLRDLVNEGENISLMISPFDRAEQISELGSPTEVGQRVAEKMIAPPDSGRTTTLVNAGSLVVNEQPYYLLEYETHLGSQVRHEVVNVTIQHHKLYTLTASTDDRRWPQVKDQFYAVAQSFHVS
ncbi:MAG: photosystem II reaction center PsbP [Thermostichales cyanobacterium SZTDM-1c_bins_54]